MKTPGQVAFEAFRFPQGFMNPWPPATVEMTAHWERAAAAVLEEFGARNADALSNPEPPKTGCTVTTTLSSPFHVPLADRVNQGPVPGLIYVVDKDTRPLMAFRADAVQFVEWHRFNETPANPQETLSQTQTQTTTDDSDTTA